MASNIRCFLDVTMGGEPVGRIITVGEKGIGKSGKPLHFKNSSFHRIIKSFVIQGGDITAGNGTGGDSIYGEKFEDECFVHNHDRPGVLSMANCGANTNSSQFFITTKPAPHLNGKHVVFGKVVKGMGVVRKMENIETGSGDVPVVPCVISDCGELGPNDHDGVPEPADGDTMEDYPEDHEPDLLSDQLLNAAEFIRIVGNENFKAQKLVEAVAKYEKAIRYLEFNVDPEVQTAVSEKKIPCYSNAAMCYLKLKNWKRARYMCDKLLNIDPNNVKGLFRRATALKELDELEEAEKDVLEARRLDPEDAAIKKLAVDITKITQARKEKERKAYASMFK
eukprot:NODE_4436_length_1168_cov_55.278469_g3921_i0.p1 GENE.NODE_4436_length_1168_cov_55.278469_g3921_i0~~NODE_4436_length_1168_cov_55.278469_g3921_i0.p1  ORF type:complete len:337 (+),score=79.87 NODE_4436_length_1168_cov_55.278469_g3921_i0:54-1064(+)